MDLLIQIVLLALGFAMLIKGADWFVDGASGIATKFGIPQLVIGLTIVAMGTSAPEAAVSISAAISGNADITIGNIVGSNILNILIILGISAVITTLAVAKSTMKYETPFMIAITVLLLVLGLDGTIGLVDGLIILVAFAAYLAYLFRMAKNNKEEQTDDSEKKMSIAKAIIFTIIGLALIVLGSNVTVDAATKIAEAFGVSERFIGLTIVALGTSLPELFTSVSAARKGNADIAIGNIVGSNIFNILFVVGLSAVIIPVPFASNFIFDTIVAIIAAVMLLLCCLKTQSLKRWAGVLMLISYAVYFVMIL
ncbi:MAG: calcium/sodium antiporter [Oscillospiraceae bacterium]|nr:calcium/sodium antiporter [Oscillospiraceae bacterium]